MARLRLLSPPFRLAADASRPVFPPTILSTSCVTPVMQLLDLEHPAASRSGSDGGGVGKLNRFLQAAPCRAVLPVSATCSRAFRRPPSPAERIPSHNWQPAPPPCPSLSNPPIPHIQYRPRPRVYETLTMFRVIKPGDGKVG